MRERCERCGHVGTLLAFSPEPPRYGDPLARRTPAGTWREFAAKYVCPMCGGRSRWKAGDRALVALSPEDEWQVRHGRRVIVVEWVGDDVVRVIPTRGRQKEPGEYRHDELEAVVA